MLKLLAGALMMAGSSVAADGFEEHFLNLDTNRWHVAHYDFSHSAFDTDWRSGQVRIRNGLSLHLDPHESQNQYAGASIRTHETLHYGRYETRLRAAEGEGVITGFFIYTGPHYHTRHDEIDIEILGKDTTRLHAAWFVDGALQNVFVPLGFDAATCIHEYAFEWWPDRIVWFVNGNKVFEQTAIDGQLPRFPGHLFANIWAADSSIAIWSGETAHQTRTFAHIESIRFTPFDIPQFGS